MGGLYIELKDLDFNNVDIKKDYPLITVSTGCGKTHLAINELKKKYQELTLKAFDVI